MTLREELVELKANLAELKDRIEADDAEAIEKGEKLQGEIEKKQAEIEQADKKSALLKVIGKSAEKEEGKMDNIKDMHLEELKLEKGSRSFSWKAYNDVQTRPTDGGGNTINVVDYDRNVVDLRQPLLVRGMFGSETISGNALTFYKLGAMEGTIGTVAEGALKNQVHFGDTSVTVALAKIAAFIKETDEALDDWAFLESAIRGRLDYEFNKAVEDYLLTSLTGTSGVQQGEATISFDNLLKAKQAVRTETGYAADAILINPADLEALLITKDKNDQYLLGGPAYGSYGNGIYAANPRIWGLPVVESASVTEGQAIVGAFKAGSSVVTKAGEGKRVEVSNSDQNDFIYNRITVRMEERMVLATRVPAAFVLVGTASSSS